MQTPHSLLTMNAENKNPPLISIVLVTYNAAQYVRATLDSIYRQNYEGPIELLVGDDCSMDNTVEICQEWIEAHKARFERTSILTPETNQGVVGNINTCMKAARGEWIKVIAGDDLLTPDAVRQFYDAAMEAPGERLFLFSPLRIFQEDSQLEAPEKLKLLPGTTDEKELDINYLFRKPLFWTNAPSFFISRKLLESVGFCPQLFRNVEDRPLFAKVLTSGYRIYHLPEPTVYYRVHDASLTAAMAGARYAETNWVTYKEIIRPCFGCLRRWDMDLRMLPQWLLHKEGSKTIKVRIFKLGCRILWLLYRTLTFVFTCIPTKIKGCPPVSPEQP